ncbi:MAG: phosphoadenylyl-sulfate reductase [Candidatus Parcubacteria bacterium]|nr:phosphoadenylyl-sulfate reductase [Burkholderiales bacterium]
MERENRARELLQSIARDYRPAALASSLSIEDMVLADIIGRSGLDIEVFVLDTGRLHRDTLDLVGALEWRYGLQVSLYKPLPQAVSQYVTHFGRDAFYESVELRRKCCEIRKVEPLRRALAGKQAWITGMRRSQASSRSDVAVEQTDSVHDLRKFNPLADWSEDEVWAYIRRYDVPYNQLYGEGYRSIGCAPCTRPVVAGEDARAGRWWWESAAGSECGIHFAPGRKLVRIREEAT